jgi:glycosyltransferase involved in cell wall biosynthesis
MAAVSPNDNAEQPPRISVIIPTYNRSWGLRRAVDSVLAQTFAAFEIIIADDHSTDDTEALARSYPDRRIHYFRQPHNVGVAANWGAGLRRASAPWVGFLMDDDYYEPAFLEARARYLNQPAGQTMLFSGHKVVGPSAEEIACRPLYLEPDRVYRGEQLLRALRASKPFIGTFTLPREATLQQWPSAERYGLIVDAALIFGLVTRANAEAVFVPGTSFRMSSHPDQLFNTRNVQVYKKTEQLFEDLLRYPFSRPMRKALFEWSSDFFEGWARLTASQKPIAALRRLARSVYYHPLDWPALKRRLYILSRILQIH